MASYPVDTPALILMMAFPSLDMLVTKKRA